MISLEESIRSYPLFQLEEVIKDGGTNYSEEAIAYAKDEFTLRKIKSLSVIDQIVYIKSMDSIQKDYILHKSSLLYPPHIIKILTRNKILGDFEPKNKVLYFPYINVPQNKWFTQILLYWDEIGTILPSQNNHEPILLDDHMRELIDARLVRPIDPEFFYHVEGSQYFSTA